MKNLIFAGLFVGLLLLTDLLQLNGYGKWVGLAYLVIGAVVFTNYFIGKVKNRG